MHPSDSRDATFRQVAVELSKPRVHADWIDVALGLLDTGAIVPAPGGLGLAHLTHTQRLTLAVLLNRWNGLLPDADGIYTRLD